MGVSRQFYMWQQFPFWPTVCLYVYKVFILSMQLTEIFKFPKTFAIYIASHIKSIFGVIGFSKKHSSYVALVVRKRHLLSIYYPYFIQLLYMI